MSESNGAVKKKWSDVPLESRLNFLKTFNSNQLADTFDEEESYFKNLIEFYGSVPVPPTTKKQQRFPPKKLITNARRDLSFYEANFELIDNSIDEWRKSGRVRDLKIEIDYKSSLGVGTYKDNAGGFKPEDMHKIFIPGESSNDGVLEQVIGSFGMGAKKAIFKLADGARVVSCVNEEYSSTCEVPQNWEDEPSWDVAEGQVASIGVGNTIIYFLKLVAVPTPEEINTLKTRIGAIYQPLIAKGEEGVSVEIFVNSSKVSAPQEISFSGAPGVEPQTFKFRHKFMNVAETGKAVDLTFCLTVGLARGLPSTDPNKPTDEEFGVDVYANGRLIQKFLKTEIGMGGKHFSLSSSSTKLVRGVLHIWGHSLAIPWDTHKREYLADHPTAQWVKARARQYLKAYGVAANPFTRADIGTSYRSKYLSVPFEKDIEIKNVDPAQPLLNTLVPKFQPPGGHAAPAVTQGGAVDTPEVLGASKTNGQLSLSESSSLATTQSTPNSSVSVENESVKNADGSGQGVPDEEANGEASGRQITLSLTIEQFEELSERFGVPDEDGVANSIYSCINSGVMFSLDPSDLNAAIEEFALDETPYLLGEKVKALLLAYIKSKSKKG